MTKLAIRIQATDRRKRWADLMPTILKDRRTEVIFDDTRTLWGGAQKTLMSYDRDDTHMLLLQDDILPCRDLVKTAQCLTELYPDRP